MSNLATRCLFFVILPSMATTYDAVIIGSGFGGSIPALRLSEDGRKVLVLEWGKKYTAKDFKHSFDLRYLLDFYVTRNNADFSFFVRYGRLLGGGSMVFSGAMYRAPSEAFSYKDRTGYKVWPDGIDRKTLDPYYDLVEKEMQVNQVKWKDVPRSGGTFGMMLDKMGLTCDRGRYNYVGCKGCGFCEAGCIYNKKITLLHSYIPKAQAKGAEFRTGCYAQKIKPKGTGYEVTYLDAGGRSVTVEGKTLLLAGNGVETPALLMRSATDLPNLSDQVGKNYNNNGDIAFVWLLPDSFPEFHLYMGRDNAGMMSYAFWKEHQITFHPGGPPPAFIAGLDLHRKDKLAWGLEHKRMMRTYYDGRMVVALAIGLIDGLGTVSIDSTGHPTVDFPHNAYLKSYLSRVEGVAQKIAAANGAELINTSPDGYEHGDAHCMAAARMATDKAHGVCDNNGEVFGYPRMFISDSAGIPGGTGVNPALTVGANAERIAAHIVKNVS